LFRPDPGILWHICAEKPAVYNVYALLAANDIQSNAAFSIELDKQKICGKTWNTGWYDKPERRLVGKLKIKSGKSKIVFEIIDKPKGHFADIHGIILQPV
jgi:hypothetical protein